MKIFVVALLLALTLAESESACSDYASFKGKNGKKYNVTEDVVRQKQWNASCNAIKAHNALYAKGQVSYELDDNFMADLNDTEKQKFLGASKSKVSPRSFQRMAPAMDRAFPASLNLTTSVCMPPIKNQGSCGSCWAFAAVTPIEWQLCNATKKLTQLSEQQLVSCSSAYGNAGCNGGWYDSAWNYIFAAPGLTSSSVHPYTATQSICTYKNTTSVVNLMGLTYLYPNETMMQQAIFNLGPISVAIYVNSNFQLYSGGVYRDATCPTNGAVNHAVVLVGYGTATNGGAFWILRNSWGLNWGMRGYMLIARGVNQCGIRLYAAVPDIYA